MKMSEKLHTRLPWRWDGGDLWHFGVAYTYDLDPHRYTGISICRELRDSETLKANMALIVAAVNQREKLVEALKACRLQLLQSNNDSEYAQEAIELARTALGDL
jgi:hypothetical protein